MSSVAWGTRPGADKRLESPYTRTHSFFRPGGGGRNTSTMPIRLTIISFFFFSTDFLSKNVIEISATRGGWPRKIKDKKKHYFL